ncbi:Hypothetical protein GbCGDNIH7_2410 [Granulibacter bethesdensis]|nr:Hypothetical protein GbCGDNIH4_2410 [Granulibacter bethesdensis CGDNIH4]APH60770.1 Hypothetical protein GbCGDNIH7_2410 [Granulibacter bethesdensis]
MEKDDTVMRMFFTSSRVVQTRSLALFPVLLTVGTAALVGGSYGPVRSAATVVSDHQAGGFAPFPSASRSERPPAVAADFSSPPSRPVELLAPAEIVPYRYGRFCHPLDQTCHVKWRT